MKKYIAQNWMKLLRIGGYITLVLIALYKINAPKTLISDYIKYGKDVAPSTGSGIAGGAVGSIFSTTFGSLSAISPALVPFFLVLLVGILGVVILHMIIDKKPDKKKK